MNDRNYVAHLSEQTSTTSQRIKKELKRPFEDNEVDHVQNAYSITDHFKITKSSKPSISKKVKTADLDDVKPELKIIPSFNITETLPCHLTGSALKFVQLELEMTKELKSLSFSDPVYCIYNPLEYALAAHCDFLQRYCSGKKKFLFLGMNPGPFGMVQTGVPFGEINLVRDWLQITGEVKKPAVEHEKRPILGFECRRSEVSGSRFWGYFRRRCVTPERFFAHCFMYNMCPLAFMNANGKNLTPPALKVRQRRPLNDICAKYLCRIVELLQTEVVIGVGNFARDRAKDAFTKHFVTGVKVEVILHPSPASPVANKGWEAVVQRQLTDIGVDAYL